VGRRQIADGSWGGRRLVGAAVAAGLVAALGWVARPLEYEVAGVSMAPGLLPGDRVVTGAFPSADALRRPRRLERWVIAAADGELAIKRVIGLPGERVAIVAGDAVIDGRLLPPSPAELAGRATAVDPVDGDARDVPGIGDGDPDESRRGWRRRFPAAELLDDAAFAPLERRLLLPVRDAGLAAIVRVDPAAPPLDVRIRVGPVAIRWRLRAPGRHAFAAGLLDGHVAAATWPLPDRPNAVAGGSSPLPPAAPAEWDVLLPAGGTAVGEFNDDTRAAELEITIEPSGGAAPGAGDPSRGFSCERLWRWRDVLHRPAADGVAEWRLGPDEFLLLGDHATGSRDSRHFGPIGGRFLLHRVAPTMAGR
jgi:type IV secretory pathway protease TraF